MKILISIATTSDWWNSLTKPEQDSYLEEHPHSRFNKTAATPKKTAASNKMIASPDSKLRPAHIQALKLPPAWTDVHYNPDPAAHLQATGRDAKGRLQYVYSAEFSASRSAMKFARVAELDKKFAAISKQNADATASSDKKVKAHAECLSLIMSMGLRPGGDDDTKAKVKAYGATTLEARHVVVDGDTVRLKFVGKKGVNLDLHVTDEKIAKMLKERVAGAESEAPVFPELNAASLSDYTHKLDGGGFKTKDFRTLLASRTAIKLIKKHTPKPATAIEYKKAVRAVAETVSKKLGNTPVVALQSYIPPQLFSAWQPVPGIPEETKSE